MILCKNDLCGKKDIFYFIEEKDGEKTSYPIDFIKDSNGDWKLDSL